MQEKVVQVRKDTLLLARGKTSFLLAGNAGSRFPLCIETYEGEYCQTLEPTHVVAVSAPEGGSTEAAWMLIELVRTHRLPLIVMPRSHPGSRRLRYVVSAGEEILLSCTIERGTHPEQHLLCSSEEMGGIRLVGTTSGILVSSVPEGVDLGVVPIPSLR
ncbi:MAG: hypothetical protein A4E37_01327 [Methanoregulaceae archaeon PtaB.Bin056]|jgi:hypothetical protein|nr:MAG: hypothetical protein A4E37_01327 [Methanoregulaceae archaeon PtaB.Bin056]